METRIATAEWAEPAFVEKAYSYRDGTVWLGRSATENQVPLGYEDDRHICLVSGNRGGKGTTSIVPTLLTWPGSICVLDPKGENATVTAARRGNGSAYSKGMGQAVLLLDPFKAAQVDDALRGRFNPLDALDPNDEEAIDEAGRVADAMVVMSDTVRDPFWDESARALIKGLILHILTARHFEGRRNLITLRALIMRGDWELAENLHAEDPDNKASSHGLLWQSVALNPALGGLLAGIGDMFVNMLLNSPKQYESVLQTANRNTEFIDSPAMQRMLAASDFQLSELKTRPEGMSLYLCLPQRYMNTHYRWLRMMIGLTVTEMEKVRGKPATGHPILLLLDEFAGLKRMEIIQNSVAQIAGFGVKMFFVLQSLEQLKGVYKDHWETFLANSGLKVFFSLEDNFSRDYVSKLIGETEVVREVRSESESTSESESVSHSTSRTESQTSGRSTSLGTSENEGTNSSVNRGRNWGTNSSKSRSFNWSNGRNWSYGGFLGGKKWDGGNEGKSDGRSYTDGKSQGWSEGSSEGVSHGTSRSRTDGTSESRTTGFSETEGTTRGTSQSHTAGSSETIQKRALITPDEIGQVFARIDDRTRVAYPGLGLAVISGARPVILHRVHYFEDFQFVGLFDPHPDFPFTPPKELTVEGSALGLSLADYGLRLGPWSIAPGQIAAGGDDGILVVTQNNTPAATIRVPRCGMFGYVEPGGGGELPPGRLFSLFYYEDGTEAADPFAELRAFCARIKDTLATQTRDKVRNQKQRRLLVTGAIAVCVLIAIVFLIVNAIKTSNAERAAAEAKAAQIAAEKQRQHDGMMQSLFSKYGSPADIKAAEQYNAGCQRDDWNSCYKLADAYASGRGVQKNLGSAARLYHKVCDHPEGAGCEDLKKLLCQTNSLTDCP